MDAEALDQLLQRVSELGDRRRAAGLVAAHDDLAEVSVAPGRWVVRSHSMEHVADQTGIRCWQVFPAAGARPVTHEHPAGWVHPLVGMLRPDRLPVWGRPGDRFRPVQLIEGMHGPAQLVLRTTRPLLAGEPPGAVGTLELDPVLLCCTRLELPASIWTLREYRANADDRSEPPDMVGP